MMLSPGSGLFWVEGARGDQEEGGIVQHGEVWRFCA